MSKNNKTKFIVLALLFTILLTSGFGCKGKVSEQAEQKIQPITLNYWRVWEGKDAFKDIIDSYNALHPNIKINYKKLRYEEYEKELLEAFAEDRGPDIFAVHSGWLKKYQSKITPLPSSITMAYSVLKGTLKKEETVELRTSTSITPSQVKDTFLDVVYSDVVVDNKIYGLPLSVDNLVMYYNRDLFNNVGIIEPPKFWNEEFQKNIKALTKENEQGMLAQSGVALGASSNIERYSDILTLIMLQNGAEMLDERGNVAFHKRPEGMTKDYAPGLEALRFYTDFANPVKEVYTWNKALPNSLEAFVQGKLAIFFGYSYHLPMIKTRAPRLNFGISKMLQIEGGQKEINFANYWVETVSNKSAYSQEAWDFIQFAARGENVTSYLAKAKKPTALRALVNTQLGDEDLSVFANQALTATNWYKGKDYNAAEVIIGEMIEQALLEPEKMDKAIGTAAKKVQQTIK